MSSKEGQRYFDPSATSDILTFLIGHNLWTEGQPLRLHMGCGEQRFDGYINIDYQPSEHTVQTKAAADIFADITTLNIPEQSVDEIRLHHVFEHFDRPTALALLCLWNQWLKIGGKLTIETPDFAAGMSLMQSPDYSYQQKQAVMRHIFGSHEARWATHCDGWYEEKFRHVLGALGFCHIYFEFRQWQMTRNITVHANKLLHTDLKELKVAAGNLFRESLLDDSVSESRLLQVWRNKFDILLDIQVDSKRFTTSAEPCEKNHDQGPLVSIFIPVYNREKYFPETLDSILAQTFQDFEVIIVDDGSTDQTLDLSRSYEASDPRLKVFSLPHGGEVKARNTALQYIHPMTKYLMNHDSDDISFPHKLKKLVQYLNTHPEIAIVGCFAEYFDDGGKGKGKGFPPIEWQPEKIRETFGIVNSMINSASLIRREVFEKIGGYRETYRSVDDYDFYARALLSGFNLANIPEVLHRIRLHPTSIGSTRAQLQEKLAKRIRENYNGTKKPGCGVKVKFGSKRRQVRI